MSYRPLRLIPFQLLLGLPFVLPAHAAEPARVQLSAYRVISTVQDGMPQERLQSLDQLKPGDLVVYEATYSNTGSSKLGNVALTVPVPDGGLVFVDGGAQPAGALASLDGKGFAPLPLMRTHTLPDGRQVKRPVPASEIRFLRWNLGEVDAGAQRSVRARMQLPALHPVAQR